MFKKLFALIIISTAILSLFIGIIGIQRRTRTLESITDSERRRLKLLESISLFDKLSQPEEDGIGLVYVYGGIYTSDRGVFGMTSGSDLIVRQLKNLRENDRVRAVVLRVNSPGGSIAASQEISDEIKKLKEDDIKVVVSMADVAASGAYYISAHADLIIANPGTITGSIGVFTGSLEFSDLFEKIGITPNVIVSGEYKDTLSSFREMRDDEKEYIKDLIMENYEMFIAEVSQGRNIEKSDLTDIANGKVFTGQKAVEYGLVDELGNFNYSLKKAAEIAGLKHPATIIQPEHTTNLTRFLNLIESKFSFLNLSSILSNYSLPAQYKYKNF